MKRLYEAATATARNIKRVKEYLAEGDDVNGLSTGVLSAQKSTPLQGVLIHIGKLSLQQIDNDGKTPTKDVDKKSAAFLAEEGALLDERSLHDHSVLSSSSRIDQLMEQKLVDLNAEDDKGMSPLRKLVRGALSDGYLDSLKFLLAKASNLDINKQGSKGGWTALHEAFSQNEGFISFLNHRYEKNQEAKDKYIGVIFLLMSAGAEPLQDNAGRTPLMCMTFSETSREFNRAIIEKFYQFEAQFYGINAEVYKQELIALLSSDFISTHSLLPGSPIPYTRSLKTFWMKLESPESCVIRILSSAAREGATIKIQTPNGNIAEVPNYTLVGHYGNKIRRAQVDGVVPYIRFESIQMAANRREQQERAYANDLKKDDPNSYACLAYSFYRKTVPVPDVAFVNRISEILKEYDVQYTSAANFTM